MRRARLWLVRHGEIEANVKKVWHGSTDSALTTRGEEQARRVAEHVGRAEARASAIYASPLQRARRTAEPIGRALGVPVRLEPGLAEYSIGAWEGESYAALLEERRFFAAIQADPGFAPPGGESPLDVVERTTAALRRIAREHAGEHVVVVGHGAAFAFALAAILHADPQRWQQYHSRNASLSELELEPEPRLLSFDFVEHL